MIKKGLSLLILLILWWFVALSIHNEIILPPPHLVFENIITLIKQPSFYQIILATFLRAHIAFIISITVALFLALICFKLPTIEELISPWLKCLQTIPQISFIILLLFWVNNEQSIFWVVFLMIFPLAYFNILEALKAIEQDYLDIIVLYHQPWYYNLKKAYLPLASSGIKATLQVGLPLALKVTVMSEVLIHTHIGIGRALSNARANIDMVNVFAWTIVLVVLVSLETYFISWVFSRKTSS